MDFQIKKYQVYFYSLPAFSGSVISPSATIFLYDSDDVYRGDLVFYPAHVPGVESVGESTYDPGSQTFRILMDQTALGGVLNALARNVPCHVRNYDRPRPELHTGQASQPGFRPRPPGIFGVVSDVFSRVRDIV